MRNDAESGLNRAENNLSFGQNEAVFERNPLPGKADKIVATPGVFNCNGHKELQPITSADRCQNDDNILVVNELWKVTFSKNAGGHNLTKYNQQSRPENQ